jgi:hypothetical protein
MEDLDMFGFRICLLVALVVATTSVTSAEDYVVPTGVTLLTEEQLLNQIIGSTLLGGEKWVEYFEPAANGLKEGRIKGLQGGSPYGGKWTINKALMCWQYDKAYMATYDDCYTTALEGNIVTWYKTDGIIFYPDPGRPKLISGNPKNL